MCIDVTKSYTAVMDTSMGTLTIALDAISAPRTVNSFVVLARYHYYEGVIFHRIIKGFVCQGGDPTGTGRGGPGYRFADELPKPGRYEVGSLAMANAGPQHQRQPVLHYQRSPWMPTPAAVLPVRQGGERPGCSGRHAERKDRPQRPAANRRDDQFGNDHRVGLISIIG